MMVNEERKGKKSVIVVVYIYEMLEGRMALCSIPYYYYDTLRGQLPILERFLIKSRPEVMPRVVQIGLSPCSAVMHSCAIVYRTAIVLHAIEPAPLTSGGLRQSYIIVTIEGR